MENSILVETESQCRERVEARPNVMSGVR
jgi:hypothetical protein